MHHSNTTNPKTQQKKQLAKQRTNHSKSSNFLGINLPKIPLLSKKKEKKWVLLDIHNQSRKEEEIAHAKGHKLAHCILYTHPHVFYHTKQISLLSLSLSLFAFTRSITSFLFRFQLSNSKQKKKSFKKEEERLFFLIMFAEI